jgi:TolB-like protein/class 3 adenylate cyclase
LTGERVERRLAAVLAADVAGYSRLMGNDEEGTLARLKSVRKTFVDPAIATHRGRIVKTTGDGVLVEFASAVDAVRSSADVQRKMSEYNRALPQDQRIDLRIGIHIGDIIIDDSDIFGDGVNIAARLEAIAEPGGVCISDDAHRQIRGKVDIVFDDMGLQSLKNIAEPIRSWRALLDGTAPSTSQPKTSSRPVGPLPLPDKPSIAVLPFQNMSGDAEQEYFADGTVEDIITALSRFKSLFVIARNSSFTYKGKAVDIKQVGRELGVRYVLEGSVRRAGGRVRITGQLVDAATGAHIWADKFDGSLGDVFGLQDQIATHVVTTIAPQLERAEVERAKRKAPEDLAAYDHYLRGLAAFHHNARPTYADAKRIWLTAVEVQPDYALVWAQLALWHYRLVSYGWGVDRDRETEEGIKFARHAISLDRTDPDVLARAGYVIAGMDHALQEGMSHLDEAISLNANLAVGWTWGGHVKSFLGEHDAAIERLLHAMRLNPGDIFRHVTMGALSHAFLFKRQYDEATRWGEEATRDTPLWNPGWRSLVASHALAGRLGAAQAAVKHLLDVEADASISKFLRYTPFSKQEDRQVMVEGLRLAQLPE